jgi:hypothetical protein
LELPPRKKIISLLRRCGKKKDKEYFHARHELKTGVSLTAKKALVKKNRDLR